MAERLRDAGRPVFARLLEEQGGSSVLDYGRALRSYSPDGPIEAPLEEAFRRELARQGHSDAGELLAGLRRHRVLQTASHAGISDGPVLLAGHYVASIALPPGDPYWIAAYSGIPFSNPSRPGCLNHGGIPLEEMLSPRTAAFGRARRAARDRGRDTPQHRLSLVPGTLRDAPVWAASLSAEIVGLAAEFRGPVASVFSPAVAGTPFTAWALRANAAILGAVLGRRVVALDASAVVADYLAHVLDDPRHPVARLLLDSGLQRRVLAPLAPAPLFYRLEFRKSRPRVEPLHYANGRLEGRGPPLHLSARPLVEGLRLGDLCPGTLLTFAVLGFLNGFRCTGGIDQLEYLDVYWRACAAAEWPQADRAGECPFNWVSTGRWVDHVGADVYPLDVLYGAPFEPRADLPLSEFLRPQALRGIRDPSRWAVRAGRLDEAWSA